MSYSHPEPVPPKPDFFRTLFEAGPANIFIPLRLFLGISFLAAGFDKLFDPQFFDSNAGGFIGNQLTAFAGQSPLGFFLTTVAVPQANLFGALVLVGELAIGLGTILGLFSRAAAFFGFILSVTLWLTASWEVTPFFLGSDLPYAIAWLTLFLAGVHPLLSLDAQIRHQKNALVKPAFPPAAVQNFSLPKGVSLAQAAKGQIPFPANQTSAEKVRLARRQFLTVAGSTVLVGAVTGAAWAHTLHTNSEGLANPGTSLALPTAAASTPQQPGSTPQPVSSGATNPPAATQPASNVAPTQVPPAQPAIQGPVIGKLAAIPVGNVLAFTTPNGGESAYLVHEKDGSVKAFSRICTHEGCEVSFSQSSQAFLCPCHGAAFDASTGAVLRRPARQPLKSFSVQVDGAGNIIYTG